MFQWGNIAKNNVVKSWGRETRQKDIKQGVCRRGVQNICTLYSMPLQSLLAFKSTQSRMMLNIQSEIIGPGPTPVLTMKH